MLVIRKIWGHKLSQYFKHWSSNNQCIVIAEAESTVSKAQLLDDDGPGAKSPIPSDSSDIIKEDKFHSPMEGKLFPKSPSVLFGDIVSPKLGPVCVAGMHD